MSREFAADESSLKQLIMWLMKKAWTRKGMGFLVTKHQFLERYPFALSQVKSFLEFELLEEFPVDESWGSLR